MWALGILDALILTPVAILAGAAILSPAKRRLRFAAVLSLAAVALGYTLFRPSPRTALAYHESQGGTWSKEWLSGVESMMAVTGALPIVVVLAALLIAVIAVRCK